jgi:L-lactate dehydrogenase
MKIAILGGAGRVGASAAFALQMAGLGREILLIDVAQEAAEGEALDLRHGVSLAHPQSIRCAELREASTCDLVIHCAGLRRKPDESRLDLINRNVSLCRGMLDSLNHAGWKNGATLLVVANPVDILTSLATKLCPLRQERIIGLGTLVDTTRFRSFIGEQLGVDATQVEALILGEHGDSMVPIWSTAAVNGTPLTALPGFSQEIASGIFQKTKTSGADVIRLKGGAGYCVGLTIARLVRAIIHDENAILPVSTVQRGILSIEDVALSMPTLIGKDGAGPVFEPVVSEHERAALVESGRVLKETLATISI